MGTAGVRRGCQHTWTMRAPSLVARPRHSESNSAPWPTPMITVFLADDNLIVREGVRALLERAAGHRGRRRRRRLRRASLSGTERRHRTCWSPTSACRRASRTRASTRPRSVRQRHPGTGVVVLSQYDDPSTRSRCWPTASPGYALPAKDRVAEGDQLVGRSAPSRPAARCSTPPIVEALVRPVARRRRAHAPTRTAAAVDRRGPADQGDRGVARHARPKRSTPRSRRSSSSWPRRPAPAQESALQRLRLLHQAIVDREEQGETLSRLLPGGLAEKLRRDGRHIGETERLVVTVLMSRHPRLLDHRRARRPDRLAGQLNEHRAAMNRADPRRGRHGHAVRRRRGDGGVRRAVPAGRPRRPGGRGGAGDAREPARRQRARGQAEGLPAVRPRASACRPARPRPRCSAPRSASSTRSSATP